MGVVLREYQRTAQQQIVDAWERGAQGVMFTLATGLGKTATVTNLIANKCTDGRGVVQAHRSELVGQLSLALAKEGVEHDITASASVRRQIIDGHLEKLGRSYYRPDADWSVESVDTALRRDPKKGVKYVFQDEAHHVLRDNKWGRGLSRYSGAKWCLPTATSGRADGMGLGRHADGLADVLLEGPNLAWGMSNGFLVEYDILTPTASDLDLGGISVGASGEFNQSEVAKRVKQSNKIVGDAVAHYKEHASGRLCIVFAVDIEHAQTLLAAYLAAGVPSELVTGNDLDSARLGALKRFESRQTLVLINVDLFGEGTDVPGVEVVQMCRPTASFPLFCQQVGRMLRLDISPYLMSIWDTLPTHERRFQISMSRKPKALLIDHVGNIHREFKICDVTYKGPPEGFNAWSLDRRGRKAGKAGAAIPMRMCNECYQPYERFYDSCPFCGALAPEPMVRGGPEQVDGALQFYDPAILAKLRADVARIDGEPLLPAALTGYAAVGARANWQERQASQHLLRNTIAAWAGKYHNIADSVNYKRFFLTFGIDVVTAATLGATEANALRAKIEKELMA